MYRLYHLIILYICSNSDWFTLLVSYFIRNSNCHVEAFHVSSVFKTLKKLRKQIKANAASVTSTLGGGLHGHLSLVLPTSEYDNISGCHFIKPVHPGTLTISKNSALHDAIRIREEQNEKLKYFHERDTIKNVLKSHIRGAMESVYIKKRIDPSTETILHDIPKIFTFLFDQYGQIKYKHLRQEENKIKNFEYSLTDLPIVIFNVIEYLVSLSEAAKLPKSQQQIITYGLNILKHTREFDTSLTNLAPADSTWHNFKMHFTNACNNILKIKGRTVKIKHFLQINKAISMLTEKFTQMLNKV